MTTPRLHICTNYLHAAGNLQQSAAFAPVGVLHVPSSTSRAPQVANTPSHNSFPASRRKLVRYAG